jgi:hypothetical protein
MIHFFNCHGEWAAVFTLMASLPLLRVYLTGCKGREVMKGVKARGGRPCAKKWEAARHKGQKGRARRCNQTERTHERTERRAAKREIETQIQDMGGQ